MIRLFLHSILVTVILLSPSVLLAEALFLKDGDIFRGQVIREDNESILFRSRRGVKRVPREDVLRILYSDDYLDKQYIYRGRKKVLHAHIVGEDDTHYYVREDLNSPDEEKIPKRQVDVVAAQRVEALERYYNKKGSKKGSRFDNLFGLRYGLNLLVSHPGSKMDFAETFDTKNSLGGHVLWLEFFFYDKWFELEWRMTPTMELYFPFNFDKSQEFGFNEIDETGFMSMSMQAVVYPFQGFNLPLGIGLGYTTYEITGIEIKEKASDDYYVDFELETVDIIVSYRVKDFLRFGLAFGLPIYKEATVEDDSGSFRNFSDMQFIPVLRATVEYYPVANLSLKFGYTFIPMVEDQSASDYLHYFHHSFEFSIGYGFNLR